jgi:hypothetical protein
LWVPEGMPGRHHELCEAKAVIEARVMCERKHDELCETKAVIEARVMCERKRGEWGRAGEARWDKGEAERGVKPKERCGVM